MAIALDAFAPQHIPVILAGSGDWEGLAPSGSPYWRPRSAAELQRKMQSQAGPGLAPEYNFVIRRDGVPLGECSVHAIDYRNRVGQLGLCIWDPVDRGHGLGTEALHELMNWATGYLGLRRLEAWVNEGNEASLAMAKRLGFVYEGTLMQRYLCAGRYEDVQVLAYIV